MGREGSWRKSRRDKRRKLADQGGREFRASKGGRDLGRKERRRQRWGEKDKEIGDKEAARVRNEEGKRAGRGSL